jgi:PAS domain S-box-containing protein
MTSITNKISLKFAIIVGTLSLLTAIVVGFVSYHRSSQDILQTAKNQFQSLAESRQDALVKHLDRISQEHRLLSLSIVTRNALQEFTQAWRTLESGATETLQHLYIHDNPYPVGEKEKLNSATDGSVYSAVHGRYHTQLRQYLRDLGYYDLFLFSPDGNLVYTVFKELDFATNFFSGPWRNTDLGKAFHAARTNAEPGFQVFFDFHPYEPSHGAPASFIASPVFNEAGDFIGVFALQVSIDRLNKIMQVSTGMGESGETYIVGKDLLMRSDSRFSKESTILKTKVNTVTVHEALSGKTGVEVTNDYRGIWVLSAYRHLHFKGTDWAIMSEIQMSEIFKPIRQTGVFLLITSGLTGIIAMVIGIFFAMRLSRPIQSITEVIKKLAVDDLSVEVPNLNSSDELGDLANAAGKFKENALKKRQNEVQFQTLVNNLSGAVYRYTIVDDNWELLFFSNEIETITGYKASEFLDEKGGKLSKITHEDDNNLVIREVADSIREHRQYEIEYRIQHANDEERWIYQKGQPIYDHNDCCIFLDGTIFDITERKGAEEKLKRSYNELEDRVVERTEELRLSEERFQLAMEAADIGLWDVNLKTGDIVVNDLYFGMLGYDPGELQIDLETWEKITHPDDFERASTVVNEFWAGKVDDYSLEYRMLTKTNEVKTILSYGNIMEWDEDHNPARATGIQIDITKRKEAEENLSKNKQLLEGFIENSAAAIYVKDLEGRFILVNREFEKVTGFKRDKVIGYTDFDLYPDDMKEIVDNIRKVDHEVVETGKLVRAEEVVEYGEKATVFLSLKFPLFNIENEVDGVCGISTDITEQKELQKDLSRSKQAAEAAAEAKASFLAAMSHEIRTPMNGVIGMVDLLRQTELDGDQKQMLQTISNSGQSLLTIINDILDFSKIEAGKMDLESVPFSLSDVVEGSAQTIAPNAERKGVRLITYIDPELPQFVAGDPVRIRQILINLGGNAIKFTEEGDVVIRAEQCSTEDEDKIGIRFSVIDNGIGISEEAQEKLFEAFSQAESSTTRKFGGTGLGLTICKKLAEMMDGDIGVKSQLGEGSEFFATLSFNKSDKVLVNEQSQDMAVLRVLLVIGNEAEQAILKRYLEYWQAQVVTSMDLTTCIQDCKKAAKEDKPFDVVVIGPQWPREEQFSLREKAGNQKALAKTKFVSLLTGNRQRARLDSPESVCIDVNPLRRAAFLSAVAIAAGRASPEVHYEEKVEDLKTAGKAPTVEEARALGTLILVAEDNVTNRDVIGRQLKLLGYACEMAEDGKLALEAWRDNDYGILLTDCHMPNMDGFELTDAIRNDEQTSNERAPIIAITANALEGEAERCLAAGMDDYMSKPIDMKELREKLYKWMPQPNETVVTAADVDTSKTPAEKVDGPIDKNALQALFGDDEDLCKEILREFISPSKNIIEEFKIGLDQRSAEAVKQAAHKLKSSAASVGAIELAELCNKLEQAGKTDNWEIIDAEAPNLQPLMLEVENYIISL